MQRHAPFFFFLLNEADRVGYMVLQKQFLSDVRMHQHKDRVVAFGEGMDLIHAWAQRGDPDDWRRCCACGLCHLSSGIAVNPHQIGWLTDKCKSSINGCLKLLGYKTLSARGDKSSELIKALPNLEGHPHELRQWSLRSAPNTLAQHDCPEQHVLIEGSGHSETEWNDGEDWPNLYD
jgi:hypothetical protein